MLEIGICKNVLTLYGEKIEISRELRLWLCQHTKIKIKFNFATES